MPKIADFTQPDSLAYRMRKRRLRWFLELLDRVPRPMRILDVGGTVQYWDALGLSNLDGLELTLLNVEAPLVADTRFQWLVGDARDLSRFDDREFDVVFSNSVIEHVGGWNDQMRMAREVRRVGARYFVQTPSYWFPVEPHFLFPGFQFLPEWAKVKLLLNFSLGWFPRAKDIDEARGYAREIRLLTRRNVRMLFPEARVVRERFCGLTKSFMAING